MPTSRQLIEYCLSYYRKSKQKDPQGYQSFLDQYFQRVEEAGDLSDIYDYFASAASAGFAFFKKNHKDAFAIEAKAINVYAAFNRQLIRVLISYDDIPFVPDSIRAALQHLDCRVFRSNLIPNIEMHRVKQSVEFEALSSGGKSFYWLDIETQSEDLSVDMLCDEIKSVLSEVEKTVKDWRRMQDALRGVIYAWQDMSSTVVSEAVLQENVLLMEWLLHHFTFLGHASYQINKGKAKKVGKGWGLPIQNVTPKKAYLEQMPSHGEDSEKPLFMMIKCARVSRVHRYVNPDIIILNVYDPDGNVIEQHHFMGMLTADAYSQDIEQIPVLRQKVKKLIQLQSLRSRYMIRRLKYLVKSYPKEELFQADMNHLSKAFTRIMRSEEQQIAEVDIRVDPLDCFASVMVYAPKGLFKTSLRRKVESLLLAHLPGQVMHYSPYFTESLLVRMHFMILLDSPGQELTQLTNKVRKLCASWENEFTSCLSMQIGQNEGYLLAKRYLNDISDVYQASHTPAQAAIDANILKRAQSGQTLGAYVDITEAHTSIRIYQYGEQELFTLSMLFPVLTNLGFEVISEHCFEEVINNEPFHIAAYHCQSRSDASAFCKDASEIESSIISILSGTEVDDALNALLVSACMPASKINVLRAYVEYLSQIGFGLPKQRILEFFDANAEFAKRFTQAFAIKFQPSLLKRDLLLKRCIREIRQIAKQATTSDDERIISVFLNCLDATCRTNFCMPDQQALVLKIEAGLIPDVKKPAPLYHLFVYSSRVMGIHIRYGRVARGGIRCSDRPDDFYAEVARLADTQSKKNALTIPGGGKGGFICRRIADISPENHSAEIEACYRIFIASMLSVADNYVASKVKHPVHSHIYDEPDPYFVVAADKGTASFSPIANEIAEEKGFWLGDAFASGGKNGYDHKKLGITARGAWESVKWHTEKQGIDVAKDPFTVAGIGDMSGDVFGNGMLLSDQIKLVAAFSFARIFIDPNPDPAISYQERLRLFRLPRSTWADYDKTLISAGGGVFDRSEKYIELSPEMRKLFNTSKTKMEPSQLISAILSMQVDVIWNGGIGVYVKATDESNYDVKDVSNDANRINASDLKAKLFAEGGNNGLTQKARIEYALAGGMINTDFIDNSAGVNISDLEVNIKILFQTVMQQGKMSMAQRNRIISGLSHQVSQRVLWNSFIQNVQIDLALSEAPDLLNQYVRFIDLLESKSILSRKADCLPTKQILKARTRGNFARPEVAVLLSYSKIYLAQLLANKPVLKTQLASQFLYGYFPEKVQSDFHAYIPNHPLRDSITLTTLVNDLVAEMGIIFVSQMMDECGCSAEDVITAYMVARSVLYTGELHHTVLSSAKISHAIKLEVAAAIKRSTYLSVRWLLKHADLSNTDKVLSDYESIHELAASMMQYLPRKYTQRTYKVTEILKQSRVAKDVIEKIQYARYAYQLFNVRFAQLHTHASASDVVMVYYQIAAWLKYHKLRERLLDLSELTYWDGIQKYVLEDELSQLLVALTIKTFDYARKHRVSPESALHAWVDSTTAITTGIRIPFQELIELRHLDYSMFSVVFARIKRVIEEN